MMKFSSTAATITKALEGIEAAGHSRAKSGHPGYFRSEKASTLAEGRPSTERRSLLAVRLSGRARQITFHVFDPRVVEDLLDRAVVDEWREKDAAAAAENRRQAAYKAKLTRSLKKAAKASRASKKTLTIPPRSFAAGTSSISTGSSGEVFTAEPVSAPGIEVQGIRCGTLYIRLAKCACPPTHTQMTSHQLELPLTFGGNQPENLNFLERRNSARRHQITPRGTHG